MDLHHGPQPANDDVMSIGIVLALVAAIGYGAADFVGGLSARRVSPWSVALVGQVAGALGMLGVGVSLPGVPRSADFAWALLAGCGSAAGTVFLYRGLARGRQTNRPRRSRRATSRRRNRMDPRRSQYVHDLALSR